MKCAVIVFPASLPMQSPKYPPTQGHKNLQGLQSFPLCRFSWPWVPSCTLFTTQMYFATGMFVCVCVLFARCFPTDVFLHLSVTTGAENGSSSQGTAGQSGLMAGSTGGVSKAAKGQGSAEKEEQTGNQKRARRQWESWSAEDKNSFFEGLYEVRACLLFMMRSKYSFFHRFVVIVCPSSHPYLLLTSLLLLSTAWERL